METEIVRLRNKEIEQAIINLSVKTANAMQMIGQTKEIAANLENMLIKAHQELEDIYVGLDNSKENDE